MISISQSARLWREGKMTDKYGKELSCLHETYQWSLEAPVDELCTFIEASRLFPMFAVGSGGSLTVAHMAALLHQNLGAIAKAVTPLEFTSFRRVMSQISVLILSASGRNSDILGALRFAAVSHPNQLMTVCMTANSPMADLSSKFQYAQLLDFDLPSGKDGFLATNSLLAAVTILIRAYSCSGTGDLFSLPERLPSAPEVCEQLADSLQPLLGKNTWTVLYGGWGLPAAMDTESKLTEAGLKNIQVTDYRNFGHGRHHWFAKRGEESGIVALITPDEKELSDKTIHLLPDNIPILRVETNETGPTGGIDLLVRVLHLVHLIGNAQGLDPGKPGVPVFGRRIYRLRNPAYRVNGQRLVSTSYKEEVAIIRKSKYPSLLDMKAEELEYWRSAYREYLRLTNNTSFDAIVFDYDGTLCDTAGRYVDLPQEVAQELVRLLKADVFVGIATGRGRSVRAMLQAAIPQEYWERVSIAYYNGADLAALADLDHPDRDSPLDPALQAVKQALEKYPHFDRVAKCEYRPKQISVESTRPALRQTVLSILLDIVHKIGASGVQTVESSHSLDVIARGVSKKNLVAVCETTMRRLGRPGNVLCIGDRGEWPGNDYDLLSTPYSLSVDTVSPDPASCWNMSQPGHRGVQATLAYLECVNTSNGTLRIKMSE
jgi:phosphoglycolate phosphatase-like HAD superfamily hydrolase